MQESINNYRKKAEMSIDKEYIKISKFGMKFCNRSTDFKPFLVLGYKFWV